MRPVSQDINVELIDFLTDEIIDTDAYQIDIYGTKQITDPVEPDLATYFDLTINDEDGEDAWVSGFFPDEPIDLTHIPETTHCHLVKFNCSKPTGR